MIGRLAAPTDESREWWWQSATTIEGVETTIGGFAATENDAILRPRDRRSPLRSQDRPRPPEAAPRIQIPRARLVARPRQGDLSAGQAGPGCYPEPVLSWPVL